MISFAEDMGNLGEKLISSFDSRLKTIQKIHNQTIKDKNQAIKDKKERIKENEERKKFCESVRKYVNNFLDDFANKFQVTAKMQHAELTKFVQELCSPIHQTERREFYQTVKHDCQDIKLYVADFLKEADVEHQTMARKQHEELAKLCDGLVKFGKDLRAQGMEVRKEHMEEHIERKKDIERLIGECKELEQHMKNLLNKFVAERQAMAEKQRQSLLSFVKDLTDPEKNGAKERQDSAKERQKFCKEIKGYVGNFLSEWNKECKEWSDECKKSHQNFERALKELAKHRKTGIASHMAVEANTSAKMSKENIVPVAKQPKETVKSKEEKIDPRNIDEDIEKKSNIFKTVATVQKIMKSNDPVTKKSLKPIIQSKKKTKKNHHKK